MKKTYKEVVVKAKEHCIDCGCGEVSRTVERDGHVSTSESVFSCGARKRELTDREAGIGRVEFEGCCCAG